MAEQRSDNEKVQPSGQAAQWSDEDMAVLAGIDERGRIKPAVLADTKADARKYRVLDALLRARKR